MRTVITYKTSEKWIFDEIEKHSGKGNWVKDILSDYLSGKLVYVDKDIIQENKTNNTILNDNKYIDINEMGCIFDK